MTKPAAKWHHIFLIGGILLIALNLRPAITGLAPLAERMRDSGLSRETIGSLTTVPLILFGVVGLWAGWLGRRFGFARVLGFGLLVLGAGCWLRSAPGDFSAIWRVLGTILIGGGIAVGNVLLPGLVKSRYPQHVGLLTSIYSTGMNLGAALGLALAIPMADSLPGGWQTSLTMWGVFAIVILIVWSPQMVPRPASQVRVHPMAGIAKLLRMKRAWQVTIFMGLQSTLFYSSVAWLPSVFQYRGMTEHTAAAWVTAMQLSGCAASLLIPFLAGRSQSQSFWAVSCLLANGLGLLGILFAPPALASSAGILLGLGLNGGFGLALLLIAFRSANAETAASLSSMAQAFGYLFAAPGPWIIGWISTTSGGWNLAYGCLIFIAALGAIAGYLAGRPGEIEA